MRDSQKQKVYNSEIHLRHRGLEGTRFKDLKSIEHWVNQKILKSAWFKKNFPNGPYKLEVFPGRTKNSRWAWGDATKIQLPSWAWTPLTILHEVSHGVTRLKYGLPIGYSHNWAFTKTFLIMIKKFMSKEVATILRKQYVARRVKHRKPPVLSTVRLEQLQVQGAKMAEQLKKGDSK
jgi:putative metallohydrolase (TIGR04338 family)